MRVLFTFALAGVLIGRTAISADTVVSYDGTTISGQVLRLKDGKVEIQIEGQPEPTRIPLGDLSRAKFVPPPPDPERFGAHLIIDNDGYHGPTEKSGKMKLRAGLQAISVLFFQGTQGAALDFSWEGPGIGKQKVPQNVLGKWKSSAEEVTYSEGLDAEGFRLPDQIGETIPQAGYKLYEWTAAGTVSEVGDLRDLAIKKYGTARQIDLNFPHAATNFGVVFYALLKVPQDGEYTFYLNSDDGSQLYVGKIPPIGQPTIREPKPEEWLLRLGEDGEIHPLLNGWDEQGIHATIKLTGPTIEWTIPPEHVREIWSRAYAGKMSEVDRSGEPVDADTVYATNKDGQIQRVSGQVLGIAEGTLKFDYQGQERSIALDRIAAVIPRRPAPVAESGPRRIRLLFDLCGPNRFVGYLKEMTSGSVTIEMPWGDEFKMSRNWVYKMNVLNGRMQSLQDLPPAEVAETPFLDHILHWQAGKSLTGEGLRIGQTSYPKGVCLHSRTKLTWDLGGEYERFQCDLGLQSPAGDLGNAIVRISADDTELFIAEEVQGGAPPQPLDLDLSGRDRLTLEVDFGRNMHIGDHVVFGNARLLRPELAP
jgi:hypothetical protein